ncbi:hypothetical protein FNV43_RR19927 [Rhamnella rubrinervis]|uniref:Uncharacterized protein n=1 Tax=Rhamnella rubrinervis TaxID=2594499 RepID=A0A8K0DZP9_9ROSA|nr:hypothetical protein FNV43_RR19927 [Rhamnella rubrinervis]
MAVKLGMVMNLAVLALLLAAVSATASSADLFDLLAANNPELFELVVAPLLAVSPTADIWLISSSYSIPPGSHVAAADATLEIIEEVTA